MRHSGRAVLRVQHRLGRKAEVACGSFIGSKVIVVRAFNFHAELDEPLFK